LGEVHFSTSCNEAAQKEFDRAVALLHSFQFSKAIQGFNATLKDDTTCAIAYWGIALSDWSNPLAPGKKDASQLAAGERAWSLGRRLVRRRNVSGSTLPRWGCSTRITSGRRRVCG
jgi:hypothetical protein